MRLASLQNRIELAWRLKNTLRNNIRARNAYYPNMHPTSSDSPATAARQSLFHEWRAPDSPFCTPPGSLARRPSDAALDAPPITGFSTREAFRLDSTNDDGSPSAPSWDRWRDGPGGISNADGGLDLGEFDVPESRGVTEFHGLGRGGLSLRQLRETTEVVPFHGSNIDCLKYVWDMLWGRDTARAASSNNDTTCMCAICCTALEPGDPVRYLRPCHHRYHLACIDQWFETRTTCPICRNDLGQVDVPTPPFPADNDGEDTEEAADRWLFLSWNAHSSSIYREALLAAFEEHHPTIPHPHHVQWIGPDGQPVAAAAATQDSFEASERSANRGGDTGRKEPTDVPEQSDSAGEQRPRWSLFARLVPRM